MPVWRTTGCGLRSSHENGVAEQGHHRLKGALGQALILRGAGTSGRDLVRPGRQAQPGRGEAGAGAPSAAAASPVPEYVVYRTKVRMEYGPGANRRTRCRPGEVWRWMSTVRRSPGGLRQGQSGRADGSSAGAGEAGIDYRTSSGPWCVKPGAFARSVQGRCSPPGPSAWPTMP